MPRGASMAGCHQHWGLLLVQPRCVVTVGVIATGTNDVRTPAPLCCRRLHRNTMRTPASTSHLLLHCDEGMEAATGALLATWLFLFIGLDMTEAVSAAQRAMGVEVDPVRWACLVVVTGAMTCLMLVLLVAWACGGSQSGLGLALKALVLH